MIRVIFQLFHLIILKHRGKDIFNVPFFPFFSLLEESS